ncbi:MAG TPA: TetR/AcrR family transcriptional regulator [Acidimicrobiales bacterium]|nr:TetR/AcrR family transcriptional regulator [Acidimicrobiales bacterium]
MSWAERAADRSPAVRRSRARGVEQATAIVEAAQRLIAVKGNAFTTQELVKEAGIALKTFYRYFPGKDQLTLAVMEDMIGEGCIRYREAAAELEDPVARLRVYITSVVDDLAGSDPESARFVTAEHWRLQSLYPAEVGVAIKPFTDLVREEIEAAGKAGRLRTSDPAHAAWLVTQLTMGVFHFYAFAGEDQDFEYIAEGLWDFCLNGLGDAGEHGSGNDHRPTLRPLDGPQSGG